jgi:hypothetical protein
MPPPLRFRHRGGNQTHLSPAWQCGLYTAHRCTKADARTPTHVKLNGSGSDIWGHKELRLQSGLLTDDLQNPATIITVQIQLKEGASNL